MTAKLDELYKSANGNMLAPKIALQNVQISFVHLTEPRVNEKYKESKPAYSIAVVIKKDDRKNIEVLQSLLNSIQSDLGGIPLHKRLRDNDSEDSIFPSDTISFSATCKQKDDGKRTFKSKIIKGGKFVDVDPSIFEDGDYVSLVILPVIYKRGERSEGIPPGVSYKLSTIVFHKRGDPLVQQDQKLLDASQDSEDLLPDRAPNTVDTMTQAVTMIESEIPAEMDGLLA